MNTISISSSASEKDLREIIQSAINNESSKLELALQLALNVILPFEQKYQVTSDYFMTEMTAEDLEGGDEEYVRWAGEYQLLKRLESKLKQIREITIH